jgi:hypothetical protein
MNRIMSRRARKGLWGGGLRDLPNFTTANLSSVG